MDFAEQAHRDRLRAAFDGSRSDDGLIWFDETHVWKDMGLLDEPFGREFSTRLRVPSERVPSGHEQEQGQGAGDTSTAAEPGPTPRRARSPRGLTDGSIAPDRVLYTWPMIIARANGPIERQVFVNHQPDLRTNEYTRIPDCHECETIWPCPSAMVLLEQLGLTEHDFDFRPEDYVSDE